MLTLLSRWLPPLLWMAVISFLSTDNFSDQNTGTILKPLLKFLLGQFYTDQVYEFIHFFTRKAAHVAEYAILGVLWYRAVNPGLKRWGAKTALLAVVLSASCAVLDEFHQAFTTLRGGNPLDVLIDTFGALVGVGVVWGWCTWRKISWATVVNDKTAH